MLHRFTAVLSVRPREEERESRGKGGREGGRKHVKQTEKQKISSPLLKLSNHIICDIKKRQHPRKSTEMVDNTLKTSHSR